MPARRAAPAPAVTVRIAPPADAVVLTELMLAFRDHLGQRRPGRSRLRAALDRLLADPSTEFALARCGGEAVGYAQCRYRFSVWSGGLDVELEDVFVVASARRQGVGTRLVACALVRARARGCRLACLATNERNAPALAAYERLGFSARRARWQGGRQLWLERPLAPRRVRG